MWFRSPLVRAQRLHYGGTMQVYFPRCEKAFFHISPHWHTEHEGKVHGINFDCAKNIYPRWAATPRRAISVSYPLCSIWNTITAFLGTFQCEQNIQYKPAVTQGLPLYCRSQMKQQGTYSTGECNMTGVYFCIISPFLAGQLVYSRSGLAQRRAVVLPYQTVLA